MGDYLLICNVCKANNVLALLRAAAAFGFTPLLIDKDLAALSVEEEIDIHVPRVGQRPGEHATIRVIKFKTLAGCESWLTDRNSLTVVGIEITDSSQSLLEVNFAALPGTGVVLVPGNEGAGLIERLRRCCHRFVYIPQYGNGTASLNVHTATSMALYYRALSRHPVSTHGPSASDLGN